jgi:hypothetical protein
MKILIGVDGSSASDATVREKTLPPLEARRRQCCDRWKLCARPAEIGRVATWTRCVSCCRPTGQAMRCWRRIKLPSGRGPRARMGSVSESVAMHAHCSVEVVRQFLIL